MPQDERLYECILFGATGYTGKYTAEHITKTFPPDFKWAIAGRSESKLKTLAGELRNFNANGPEPKIEVAQLDKPELLTLASKTKVLATTVGPYHKYGSVVFEACAETGTHYVDVTGEVPWVLEMVRKYHDTAKRTGAIMLPQSGIESAPADLLCWMLASHFRNTLGVGTREVVNTMYEAKGGASGGTLATALTILDTYSLKEMAESRKPWIMSPVQRPNPLPARPILEQLTGLRTVRNVGLVTTNIMAAADKPIVQRSWGLFEGGKFYGPNFSLNGYLRVKNALLGFVIHLASTFGVALLLFKPIRSLLMRRVHQPGEGPTREQTKGNCLEYRATGEADTTSPDDPRYAMATMRWEGGMYHFTGVLIAEAAFVLARDASRTFAHKLGGGVLTPSTLGEPFVERLTKAGVKFEVKRMP